MLEVAQMKKKEKKKHKFQEKPKNWGNEKNDKRPQRSTPPRRLKIFFVSNVVSNREAFEAIFFFWSPEKKKKRKQKKEEKRVKIEKWKEKLKNEKWNK